MMTIKEKYSLYWEVFEAPVNWKKLEELHIFFEEVGSLVKKHAGLKLHVAPHTKIRLAQGPIPVEEIKELAIAAIQHLAEGTLRPNFYVKSVKFDRKEVYSNKYFCVCKEWISEKGQIDLISAGVRGRRPNIQRKSSIYGVDKDEFEYMSNDEKRELFRRMGL